MLRFKSVPRFINTPFIQIGSEHKFPTFTTAIGKEFSHWVPEPSPNDLNPVVSVKTTYSAHHHTLEKVVTYANGMQVVETIPGPAGC